MTHLHKLDGSRFPLTSAYLDRIPQGVAAYAQYRTTAEFSLMLRSRYPQLLQPPVPPPLATMLGQSWRADEWISEVKANTLVLLARELLFDSDVAFAQAMLILSRRQFEFTPVRALLHLLSPHLILMGAAKRWNDFHQKSTLITGGTKNNGRAVLQFPPHLFAPTNVLSLSTAFAAALECSRAEDPTVTVQRVTPTEALFEVHWS